MGTALGVADSREDAGAAALRPPRLSVKSDVCLEAGVVAPDDANGEWAGDGDHAAEGDGEFTAECTCDWACDCDVPPLLEVRDVEMDDTGRLKDGVLAASPCAAAISDAWADVNLSGVVAGVDGADEAALDVLVAVVAADADPADALAAEGDFAVDDLLAD